MTETTNQKVLLVDDDSMMLEMYQRLMSLQFSISTASSGPEAIAVAKSEGPFAVVLTDFTMPGMDGIELLRRFRASYPETSRMLLSGRMDLPDLIGESDLAELIDKPCDYHQLIERVKLHIIAHQQRIQHRGRE